MEKLRIDMKLLTIKNERNDLNHVLRSVNYTLKQ